MGIGKAIGSAAIGGLTGGVVEKKRAVFGIKSSKDELSKTERGENGFGKSGLM